MEKRKLGGSDLNITALGIGAWAMGGGSWEHGWGAQDDQDSIAAIRAALEAGWNWIDTAAVYGLGHSEEVVARALAGVSDRPYIFTKCARSWDSDGRVGHCLKREALRLECEASLKRLRVEAIDLLQLHWPDPEEDMEEGWETLVRLKEEGKIRWGGVCNFKAAQLARIRRLGEVTSLQGPYSIISPEGEREVFPYCLKEGLGVLVYSPMKSGLLSGKMTIERVRALPENDFRKRAEEFMEPRLSRNLALVERLREIGARYGRNPGEVAISWCLHHPAVTGAIVGLRSAGQLRGVAGAADLRLGEADLALIGHMKEANP